MTGEGIVLRPMESADLPAVGGLENDLFTEPWPASIFEREIADRQGSWTVVGLRDDRIVCYAVAWLGTAELHIANLAVAAHEQGKGVGAWLLDRALERGREAGCLYATLEVRVSNERAIRLYEKRGFRGVAMQHGYYVDDGEDALVMWADLIPAHGEEQDGLV